MSSSQACGSPHAWPFDCELCKNIKLGHHPPLRFLAFLEPHRHRRLFGDSLSIQPRFRSLKALRFHDRAELAEFALYIDLRVMTFGAIAWLVGFQTLRGAIDVLAVAEGAINQRDFPAAVRFAEMTVDLGVCVSAHTLFLSAAAPYR